MDTNRGLSERISIIEADVGEVKQAVGRILDLLQTQLVPIAADPTRLPSKPSSTSVPDWDNPPHGEQ